MSAFNAEMIHNMLATCETKMSGSEFGLGKLVIYPTGPFLSKGYTLTLAGKALY